MIALIRAAKFGTVGLIVVAAIGALAYAYQSAQTSCGIPLYRNSADVAKARHDLHEGQRLTSSDVTFETVPERFLPPRVLLKKDVHGSVGDELKHDVPAGALILATDLERPQIGGGSSCDE